MKWADLHEHSVPHRRCRWGRGSSSERGGQSSGFGALLAATLLAAVVAETLDVLSAGVTSRIRGRSIGTLHARWPRPADVHPRLCARRCNIGHRLRRGLAVDRSAVLHSSACSAEALCDVSAGARSCRVALSRANLSFAAALVTDIGGKRCVHGRSFPAVAIYTRDIADENGLAQRSRRKPSFADLFMTLERSGCLRIPTEQGRATDTRGADADADSLRNRRTDPQEGRRLCRYREIVRHHHERIDGEGYRGRLGVRYSSCSHVLIAVADAYNAMTSNRPYRKAMRAVVARDRLPRQWTASSRRGRGSAFVSLLAGADDNYGQPEAPSSSRSSTSVDRLDDFTKRTIARTPPETSGLRR